jgi:geranylgeranyl diphosphate synthase type I
MRDEKSETSEDGVAIYCALELFHAFCLIHDDVIDHGEIRHGVPTHQTYYLKLMQKEKREGDLVHIAASQAIMVGDLLYNYVFNLIHAYRGEGREEVFALFCEMAQGVMIGQMLDVDATTRNRVSKRFLEAKMKRKTAEYSFVYPLRIGQALNGREDKRIDAFCRRFGTALGLAFQIQDDLLDTLPKGKLGRSSFTDVREGQHTLLSYYICQSGSREQKKTLAEFWRSEITNPDRLTDLFLSSGAIAFAQNQIQHYVDQAKHNLYNAPLSPTAVEELKELLDYIANRSS